MKPSVFIVEDDEDIRYILDIYLSEEGFLTTSFENVAEFKSVFPAELPDIFLLDVMLPDGYGTDLCNDIRNEPSSAELPVVMMSAHAAAARIDKVCHADGFIQKPFELTSVQATLMKFLKGG